MNENKRFYLWARDMPDMPALAAALLEEATMTLDAWYVVRPYDTRLVHAIVVTSGGTHADPAVLASIDALLVAARDDIRRWTSPAEHLSANRALAAVSAVLAACRAVGAARCAKRVDLALAICHGSKAAADAVLEPLCDVRNRIVTRAVELAEQHAGALTQEDGLVGPA